MLNTQDFIAVIKNTPLVSIDLCLIFDNQILLGKRNNEPLKGLWFTPGGRILKNETWLDCLSRVMLSELGLNNLNAYDCRLMGIWDHFYNNSVVGDNISTHYVNLPHYISLKTIPLLKPDSQHSKFSWFDLAEVSNNNNFHEYTRNYALWLIEENSKSGL